MKLSVHILNIWSLVILVLFIFLFPLANYTSASQLILEIPKTTDCSRLGDSNPNFSNACINSVQTNGVRPVWTSADPYIGFSTEVGHDYQVSYDSSSFSRWYVSYSQEDYIGIYVFPYIEKLNDGYGGWLCGRPDCSIRDNGFTFQALTNYTSLFIGSGCANSTGCYLTNLTITDLDAIPPPSPKLTVIKNVINDNGGLKQASDFTINAVGLNATPSAFLGSTDGTTVTLSAGEYSITETPDSEYSSSLSQDCSGTIANGEEKICTITNDDIALPPTPSPTPTPTPTPKPISKVVFLPGLGASWNADAILNCKNSGYSGDWTLAPFAKSVYENILAALPATNWNTKPFYYDWRKDVRDNASTLSTFINNNTSSEEKVNLVGHSMGGLVGRAYLESGQGEKINSYISVGSPHQGSALAYPFVSAGEIWDSNLISKVAKTILLKRCGDNIPSALNLLPTTNYLRNNKNGQLKPVDNMTTKNNWLPTSFSIPFGNVKIGTLSGTGFPTLSVIKVNDPTKRDIQLGNWLDGKPTAREKTSLGDGTVLTSSSQLTNADNQIINQNHSGLVASQEGIAKILNFLGAAPAQGFKLFSSVLASDITHTSMYDEPNSIMVIVGYPGNFWVTDPDGVITQDDKGMVSYLTPKSGEYKLNIVPNSGSTLFIVTQILPNGNILYKEYRINGHQPISKVINLDNKQPLEDILKDPKPKKGNEPDHHHFWEYFWKHFHRK